MRIGSTDTYTIEDIVFHVKRAWGPRRAHQETVRGLPARDDETQAQIYERLGHLETAAIALIEAVVVSVDGLQDSSGKAVEWSPAFIQELPETVIEELVRRITFNQGDDASADPLATAPPSPSQPPVSTEAMPSEVSL